MQYLRAAYDRSTAEESQWHEVFDISDPANVKLLTKQQLKLEGYVEEGGLPTIMSSVWLREVTVLSIW